MKSQIFDASNASISCRLSRSAFLFFAAVVLAGCSGSSETAVEDTQVTFRASGVVDFCSNPCPTGTSIGAPLTVDIIADNGSKETNARAWTYTSVKQMTVRVGTTYTAIIDPAKNIWGEALGSFTTDANGNLDGVPLAWVIVGPAVGEPQKDSNGDYIQLGEITGCAEVDTRSGWLEACNIQTQLPSSWTLLP